MPIVRVQYDGLYFPFLWPITLHIELCKSERADDKNPPVSLAKTATSYFFLSHRVLSLAHIPFFYARLRPSLASEWRVFHRDRRHWTDLPGFFPIAHALNERRRRRHTCRDFFYSFSSCNNARTHTLHERRRGWWHHSFIEFYFKIISEPKFFKTNNPSTCSGLTILHDT